ncbi:MAG: hypothetical protein K8H89_03730 [Flavobacteriales bacterium]|jgi:two-component sensor histidine kinase|nr:hypothetical protein [Flavobacteriales bacterium]MCB0759328.1 hypothetical protein [Flavobacteriales bacterium]
MRSVLIPSVVFVLLIGTSDMAHASPSSDPGLDPAAKLTQLRAESFVAERTGRNDQLLKSLRSLRDLQIQYGAIDSAMNTCLRVVRISGLSDDRFAMAHDWRSLSIVARRAGDLSGAVAAGKRRVLILKTTGDRELEQRASMELLDLLLESKRYREFKHQSEANLAAFKQERNGAGEAQVLCRQGECLTAQGRPVDALSLLHLALRNRDMLEDKKETARLLFALAKANMDIANWSAARSAFEEAMDLTPTAPTSSPELYGLLAGIHEGMGDLRSALHYERVESRTKDSLFSATKAERAARIQLLYGLRAKDEDMATLRSNNQAAADQLLREKTKTRWSLFLSAGLSVGLLLLVLLRRRELSSVRRTRFKNRLITDRAKEAESKTSELEREIQQLSQALVRASENREELTSRSRPSIDEIRMVEILVKTQARHTTDTNVAKTLGQLQSRIGTLNLINKHLGQADELGILQLKAHFTALADHLVRERGLQGTVQMDIKVDDEVALDHLLPLSLLFSELIRVSLEHEVTGKKPRTISVGLRHLGQHQCELLYLDEAGAINAEALNNSSLGAELVLAWARALGGSILLLKGEVTAFQYTFEQGASAAMRKAS